MPSDHSYQMAATWSGQGPLERARTEEELIRELPAKYRPLVAEYFRASRAAFPDRRNEVHAVHHADDAVIVEFDLLGTHDGPLGGIPPTGQAFRCPMVAFFFFEPDGDGIVCERVYFDSATILRQLKVTAP